MQSSNKTFVGPGQTIVDPRGNVWTITATGQVAVNGTVDSTTANVTHLAYANGLVWQENTHDLWWSKASPAGQWTPLAGTAAVPFPIVSAAQYETVVGASAAGAPNVSITDKSGNTWSIANGQVVVNGVADQTTANVIEIANVGRQIWQENSQNSWWSKSAPADAWRPASTASANPVTGSFYIGNTSGDLATINVGELTASPEGGSGIAPRSAAKIVTPGVQANGSTITVSTETATLVVSGNSSLTNDAALNLIGAYRTPTIISGPIQNNGAMTVDGSTVRFGALNGNGAIRASNGSTLDIQSASAGNTVQLASSHLLIGGQGGAPGGLSFLAPITMDGSSSITLNATQATSEVLKQFGGSISEVFLYNGATAVADLKVTGVSQLYATVSGSGCSATVTLSTSHGSNVLPTMAHAG
ncbi:MAG: hypothetical protein QOG73_2772 [Acetobacteraceae bacterium]|nr:hypothetical protein [Acetobacteraceae bacterium]